MGCWADFAFSLSEDVFINTSEEVTDNVDKFLNSNSSCEIGVEKGNEIKRMGKLTLSYRTFASVA
jgi:hypothetical protein